jgi:hypothetical protein
MKTLVGFIAIALAAFAAACSSLSPVPIKAGEICYRCRSVINEPKHAAEMISPGGLVSPFKSPDCIAKYVVEHPNDKSAVFVSDSETGRMLTPDRLFFVHTTNLDNGKEDFLAFASEKAAVSAAVEHKTTAVKWTDVLQHARAD